MRQFKYKLPQTDTRPLFYKDKGAYADSVLTANKDKEWVQRLINKDRTSIPNPLEPNSNSTSTHLMADDGNGYVYPTVIKDKDGNLIHYPTVYGIKTEDDQIEYAKKNNLGIQLPKEEGTWFANNGYKTGKIGQEYVNVPKWKTAKSPSQVKSGGVRLFKSQ
jgi:hypothetical protein